MPTFNNLTLPGKLLALAIALFVPSLPLWSALLDDPFLLTIATRILIFGLAAASLDLALGVVGLVSFGHGAFLGLGAYTAGIMFQHEFTGTTFLGLPPTQSLLLQLPIAFAAAGLFACLTGVIALRTRGIAFIMITLAFAQMLFFLFVSLRVYNGEDGIALWNRGSLAPIADAENTTVFFFLCLGMLVAFLLAAQRVVRSPFGATIAAIRQNEQRVAALGIGTFKARLVAYTLSGACTGVAGLLLAHATYFVGPSYLSWQTSGELIVMVVLGGLGTIIGPVLGAASFILLEQILPPLLAIASDGLAERWKIVLGPVLVAVALYARAGLMSLVTQR